MEEEFERDLYEDLFSVCDHFLDVERESLFEEHQSVERESLFDVERENLFDVERESLIEEHQDLFSVCEHLFEQNQDLFHVERENLLAVDHLFDAERESLFEEHLSVEQNQVKEHEHPIEVDVNELNDKQLELYQMDKLVQSQVNNGQIELFHELDQCMELLINEPSKPILKQFKDFLLPISIAIQSGEMPVIVLNSISRENQIISKRIDFKRNRSKKNFG